MTSINIAFMLHMRNIHYEKIKQDLDKKVLKKQDLDNLEKDKKELVDKDNLENCKKIFKNYMNYLEKKVKIVY